MTRREFTTKVRVAVIKRATKPPGVIHCESCGCVAKKFQIDHKRADGLLGDPTIENAELICDVCYGIKNPQDTRAIAKAKRREARHLGANSTKASAIKSSPFSQSAKTVRRQSRDVLPMPKARAMFKDE
jgi:hypothetical protein